MLEGSTELGFGLEDVYTDIFVFMENNEILSFDVS